MNNWEATRLTDAELKNLFDRLFPFGFAGADVVREIAPEQWENSPFLACFHPSPQQVFDQRLRRHRRMQELGRTRRRRGNPEFPKPVPSPVPTMEQVLSEWKEQPVNVTEEVTELVGRCLWDVFSDNHEVFASDGRIVDIGSFREASTFLDECLSGPLEQPHCGDEYHFYMGSTWLSSFADLGPVYRMIFRRLRALGADWKFHFPRLFLVDLCPLAEKQDGTYSPSEAFGKEQEQREHQAELEKARAELDELHNQACRDAMDEAPPQTVRAYHEVFGRYPRGWAPLPGEGGRPDEL
jgi:hypothetical protein